MRKERQEIENNQLEHKEKHEKYRRASEINVTK